jgi:CheY-like chemotaxis protein
MNKDNCLKPPTQLRKAGKALWVELTEKYDDFSPHEMALLVQACQVSDRLAELNELVDREGATVHAAVSGDLRAHPALIEARQQQITLARLLAAMRLPDSDGLRPQQRQVRGIYQAKRLRQLRDGA